MRYRLRKALCGKGAHYVVGRVIDEVPVGSILVVRKGKSRNAMDTPYQAIITLTSQTECHDVATVLSETLVLMSPRESSGHCSWLI